MTNSYKVSTRLNLWVDEWQNKRRIKSITNQVATHAQPNLDQAPVIIFNTSSRLTGLSLNASFTSLTAWSLRLNNVPVIHFVCQAGLNPCMLGTNRQDYKSPPPCKTCLKQSNRLYADANTQWFTYQEDDDLAEHIKSLEVDDLCNFDYPLTIDSKQRQKTLIPLGAIVLPSVRWALRRHHLLNDLQTRHLLRSYILSAYSLAKQFDQLLEIVNPSTIVIFNGSIYPEAIVRWVAIRRGIRAITHEVGFQQLSAFFTDGEATAYPINIPADFELTAEQNDRLDDYLEKRFQGQFTMAGIKFWPEIKSLDEAFLNKASNFRQIVPIFTNVAYDTSQVHASTVYPSMFAWLDTLLAIIRDHPETLFVIRAHPDEMREGTAKLANESVQDWVIENGVYNLPNVVFISPIEYISSYELIHRAKFVIVYNSSIGLEATLLGKVVICGGRARYTQYQTVYFPDSQNGFCELVRSFLVEDEVVLPSIFQKNARNFLFYQLYRTSIPLDEYIESIPRQGYVKFKRFRWDKLSPKYSTAFSIINDGIVKNTPFLIPENM